MDLTTWLLSETSKHKHVTEVNLDRSSLIFSSIGVTYLSIDFCLPKKNSKPVYSLPGFKIWLKLGFF